MYTQQTKLLLQTHLDYFLDRSTIIEKKKNKQKNKKKKKHQTKQNKTKQNKTKQNKTKQKNLQTIVFSRLRTCSRIIYKIYKPLVQLCGIPWRKKQL